jgi:predicted N-acyltransferase
LVNYRTRIVDSLAEIGQARWDALLALQPDANPFLSFAFLHAMHETGCASAQSGWQPHYLTLWQDEQIEAAMPLYLKWLTHIAGTAWRTTQNCCRLSHLRR